MMASSQRSMAALALASSALVLGACLLGLGAEIAYAVPPLALAVPLLAGRFVGEERIAHAARARRRRPLRAPRHTRIAGRAASVVLPRGGRLIAFSLAVRPPPLRC
jgi:hypothetical protein